MELLVFTTTEHTVIVLCTEFGAGGIENSIEQVGIPRCGHGDWLGEHGDVAHVGGTVESFAPPEELLDAEPWNSWTLIEHELGFLFECQPAAEVFRSLLGTEVGVLIGQRLRLRQEQRYAEYEKREYLFHV